MRHTRRHAVGGWKATTPSPCAVSKHWILSHYAPEVGLIAASSSISHIKIVPPPGGHPSLRRARICRRTCIPDCGTFPFDAIVGRLKIDREVRVAEEKAILRTADVGCIAINVDRRAAALARDPSRRSPFADAPRWLVRRAPQKVAVLAPVAAAALTPVRLAREMKERGIGIADLGTDAVRRVVVAPSVATRITLTHINSTLRECVCGCRGKACEESKHGCGAHRVVSLQCDSGDVCPVVGTHPGSCQNVCFFGVSPPFLNGLPELLTCVMCMTGPLGQAGQHSTTLPPLSPALPQPTAHSTARTAASPAVVTQANCR
jgi:hypothetical protein